MCNFCSDETLSQYICVPSFVTRIQHRKVTDINNNYKFLLPEAVCCYLQTCIFCFDSNFSQYISVPSMVVGRPSIEEVIGINNNYKFLLPKAVCCCLQTC